MSEPIAVDEALKALHLLKEVGEQPEKYWNERSMVYAIKPPCGDFHVAAREVLPGMVEYVLELISPYRPHDKIGGDCRLGKTLAPIVAWARTQEAWSK